MINLKRAQAGFTLIEVVAAAALLGLMVTMAMPSLSAANSKVKNSRLKADLATVDQAIQLYVIDNGKLPKTLSDLSSEYVKNVGDIKDATGKDLEYKTNGTEEEVGNTYTLTGLDTAGKTVTSTGSTKSS